MQRWTLPLSEGDVIFQFCRYNKREDDFETLKDFNDYLEQVEDMTVNLIEGIDVAAIEAEIAEYHKENYEQIVISRARKAEEEAAALKASKAPIKNDASDMATEQSFQTAGGGIKTQGQYAPATVQLGVTGMAPQPVPLGTPNDHLQTYAADDEETMKLRAERGARAGGWTIGLSRKRAFEEAFNCIWV